MTLNETTNGANMTYSTVNIYCPNCNNCLGIYDKRGETNSNLKLQEVGLDCSCGTNWNVEIKRADRSNLNDIIFRKAN